MFTDGVNFLPSCSVVPIVSRFFFFVVSIFLMLRVMGKLQGGSRDKDGFFENRFYMVSFGFLCSLGLAKGSCVYCGGKFLSRFLQ